MAGKTGLGGSTEQVETRVDRCLSAVFSLLKEGTESLRMKI